MLDIHRLKIFVRVADLKSFSKAAHLLYLTQPTVSQHINSLEHFTGLALFDRTGREAVLTKAGEILYRYAVQILRLQDEAEQSLDHFRGKKSGHIILGASTIPGEYVLPVLLGRFKELYPDIQVTIRISGTGGIIKALVDREIELGVVGARIKDDRLQYSRFMDDELVLVVSRGHRWWSKKEIDTKALAGEPFVLRERGSGTRIAMERHLKEAGIAPDALHIIAEVGSTTAVKEAVKARLGVSFISRRAVAEEVAAGTVKIISLARHSFTRTFYLVTEKKRTPSPLCAALNSFLHKNS